MTVAQGAAPAAARRGLTDAEAAERLRRHGPNALPAGRARSLGRIVVGVVAEPMFLLLLACGGTYLLVGSPTEALALLSFVVLIMAIAVYQERKTERALEALRDLSSPRALVIRSGRQLRVAGRDVVPGDLVVLAEGDRVPADGVLVSGLNLAVDESLLTGEAVPVRKAAGDGEAALGRPGGDDLASVYSGTLVVRGHGLAEVRTTGTATELGKIGRSLSTLAEEPVPLEGEVGRLVRRLAVVGLALCLTVVLVYALTRGHWLDGLLAGLTLAMAIVPNEYPVVLSVFVALGAWRISRRRVLTRRPPAVQTLGSATVLCVDKTGTLTENRMAVARLWVGGEAFAVNASSLPERFHALAATAVLASQADPFDPMEIAFKDLARDHLPRDPHAGLRLEREYPLGRDFLAVTRLWRAAGEETRLVAIKGAPEAVLGHCALDGRERAAAMAEVGAMADAGLRVLAVARAQAPAGALPEGAGAFRAAFLGLVGLADPVRAGVPAAVAECHRAGIRVVMVTGDYPGTARAIAREIGLEPADVVTTGAELEAMDDEALRRRVGACAVFARVVPEQKLRLVQALKASGEVVAMTGDGVNDAPALKAAHIGVAMGGRGTDVAREAAAIVLLDDDFSSIVAAVRLGRRIFDNLRKAMAYIFAVHVPVAGMSLIPVLLGWPLALLPVHVVFLEMVIDPACTIAFEAEGEEGDVMERPPRRAGDPLFSARVVAMSVAQGLALLGLTLLVYALALSAGRDGATARALAYVTLTVGNLGLILASRSSSAPLFATLGRPNGALWWIVAGAVVVLGLSLTVPDVHELFGFGRVRPLDVALSLAAALVAVAAFEAVKAVAARRVATGTA